ncbi:hypothetical protein ABKV70_01425 [Enterobacter hormaechei]|uniref:hypothetical protein n=1 Tax=Enterobacter hormaechei TaxID=158836 RepID=UPI00139F4DF1|nr:hypothetical protein [Enterobacter hormaechei]MBT1910603.1 hypothetical protein [Enterobacter hormaechei subsp. xiangfangensis]MVX98788.1 hypothetical protein [Enterobacteriaceae bacterium 8376wB9]HCM9374910.1 hypothetical protein [Enterobacter hormaechei subsp. steigerwaltii]MBG0516276.1 hypothetical protein [Enterobacter hormaechei]MBI8971870.1 hypothetical protein [Enterobacter hormaechei]
MAGDYRIYYLIDNEEHSLKKWLETDAPTLQSEEVIEAVMSVAPHGKAPSILRLIDLDKDGKPMVYDEFLIQGFGGINFGLIYRRLGHDGWFYLTDPQVYGFREGSIITDNKLTVVANSRYSFSDKADFPVIATIDWDRLSLRYGYKELYLVPTSA